MVWAPVRWSQEPLGQKGSRLSILFPSVERAVFLQDFHTSSGIVSAPPPVVKVFSSLNSGNIVDLSLAKNSISASTLNSITMTLGISPSALLASCYCCLPYIAWLQVWYVSTHYKDILRKTRRSFRQDYHWISRIPCHRHEVRWGVVAWRATLFWGHHQVWSTPTKTDANLTTWHSRNSWTQQCLLMLLA